MVDLIDLYNVRFKGLARVLTDIINERKAQNEQWGGAEHDDHHELLEWAGLIQEHLGRLHRDIPPPPASASRDAMREQEARIRRRLLVVAALAAAAIESSDRRGENREARWADVDQALAGDHLGDGHE